MEGFLQKSVPLISRNGDAFRQMLSLESSYAQVPVSSLVCTRLSRTPEFTFRTPEFTFLKSKFQITVTPFRKFWYGVVAGLPNLPELFNASIGWSESGGGATGDIELWMWTLSSNNLANPSFLPKRHSNSECTWGGSTEVPLLNARHWSDVFSIFICSVTMASRPSTVVPSEECKHFCLGTL